MITTEEKIIIEETETKMELKRIFEELTSSMIEYYEKNYLTRKQLKSDIQEAWMLTMTKAREIDEKIIKEICLNERNEKLKNNENPNPNCSDTDKEEKIKALKIEIEELKEEIRDANKSRRYYQNQYIIYLKKENEKNKITKDTTPEIPSHNARGAGRKQKITEKQIAIIQMYRAQGKTLSDISRSMGISYGNVQKYSKL